VRLRLLPPPNFFGKKLAATFSKKKSLSRYDAALDRFSPHEPRGARRFFGDPMALIRFTGTFLPARFLKTGGAENFFGPKPSRRFPKLFFLITV
jgi:hypothetical protein